MNCLRFTSSAASSYKKPCKHIQVTFSSQRKKQQSYNLWKNVPLKVNHLQWKYVLHYYFYKHVYFLLILLVKVNHLKSLPS